MHIWGRCALSLFFHDNAGVLQTPPPSHPHGSNQTNPPPCPSYSLLPPGVARGFRLAEDVTRVGSTCSGPCLVQLPGGWGRMPWGGLSAANLRLLRMINDRAESPCCAFTHSKPLAFAPSKLNLHEEEPGPSRSNCMGHLPPPVLSTGWGIFGRQQVRKERVRLRNGWKIFSFLKHFYEIFSSFYYDFLTFSALCTEIRRTSIEFSNKLFPVL